jgi:hypothetical protein
MCSTWAVAECCVCVTSRVTVAVLDLQQQQGSRTSPIVTDVLKPGDHLLRNAVSPAHNG